MAVTATLVAVRSALMTALAARGELAGVQVVYAHPGQAVQAEAMWSQGGTTDYEFAAFRANRKTRNEGAEFEVVVSVLAQGDDQATADARAFALGASLENYLADNPCVAALVAAGATNGTWVSSYRLTGGLTDAGRVAELVYTVTYKSRLN